MRDINGINICLVSLGDILEMTLICFTDELIYYNVTVDLIYSMQSFLKNLLKAVGKNTHLADLPVVVSIKIMSLFTYHIYTGQLMRIEGNFIG